MTEDWAEVRRLHKSEQMSIRAIVRRTGLARNTVRAALAADEPPKYRRGPAGSAVDGFEPAIRALLAEFPSMPATVIAERIGWDHSSSVLRAKVALLRPLYAPADRTTYVAGEIVQWDLWLPGKVIPVESDAASRPAGWVGGRPAADLPVLTMVAAFLGFIMALLLPTGKTGDLVAGMWQLLSGLGGVPKTLVWDNESGIGQHHRLTFGARGFAGTLGTRIYQTSARDPEAKGVVERANGFLETSFMPGRQFASAEDYNHQLATWLPRANSRVLRRTGQQPGHRTAADVAAMGGLPPVPPSWAPPNGSGWAVTTTSGTGGNGGHDHLRRPPRRDPSAVLVNASEHHRPRPRCDCCWAEDGVQGPHRGDAWARRRSNDRRWRRRGTRALSDYDDLFALPPTARPRLEVVR